MISSGSIKGTTSRPQARSEYQLTDRSTRSSLVTMKPAVHIRKATLADLDAITAIYNEAIATTTATFDTEPKTAAQQLQWFEEHGERSPILVAVVDGNVVGW